MKKSGMLGAAVMVVCFVVPGGAQMRGEAKDAIEVPLRIEQGVMVVTVESSLGEEFDFILGSASGATVLSQSAKVRIGDATLTMSGVAVPTEGAQDLPDDELSIDGTSFDGVIGANTLNLYDVLVDAPGRRVVFKEPARSVDWPGMDLSEPSRLLIFHGLIVTMDIGLDGESSRAVLELRAPNVIVSPPLGEKASIAPESKASLTIGGTTLTEIPIVVRDNPAFASFDPLGEGFAIVGAAIALDCAISISFVHQEIRTCVR